MPKKDFLEFLFVPLTKGGKENIMHLVEREPILNLISKMMRITNRIDLQVIQTEFHSAVQLPITSTIANISETIQKSILAYAEEYNVKSDVKSKGPVQEYFDVLKKFS